MRRTELAARLAYAAILLALLAPFPRSPDLPVDPGLLFLVWFVALRVGSLALGLDVSDKLLLPLESLPFLLVGAALAGRLGGLELGAFLAMALAAAEALLSLEAWLPPQAPRAWAPLLDLAAGTAVSRVLAAGFRVGRGGMVAFIAASLALAALASYRRLRRKRARES